ncbi:hypothetical protein HanHA300_Chr13g0499791 [Helianthus annuus]|nr:hypothetical protein HanHA300_Chr13g0499791 [Helianthus annuus]
MFPIDQLPLILKSQTSLLLILFANIMITLALNFIVSVFAYHVRIGYTFTLEYIPSIMQTKSLKFNKI